MHQAAGDGAEAATSKKLSNHAKRKIDDRKKARTPVDSRRRITRHGALRTGSLSNVYKQSALRCCSCGPVRRCCCCGAISGAQQPRPWRWLRVAASSGASSGAAPDATTTAPTVLNAARRRVSFAPRSSRLGQLMKPLEATIEAQFGQGRLYALVTSRPGQCGRCDGCAGS